MESSIESQNSIVAVYLGTFDPLTNGHLDVILRGSELFSKLFIGVVANQRAKNLLFKAKQRVELIEKAISNKKNIQVDTFESLAVEYAAKVGAQVIVRGLRTEADFAYEMQMAMMNRKLNRKLETIFIPSRQDLSHISSSLVKEVASLGGDISGLVPDCVKDALENAFYKYDKG